MPSFTIRMGVPEMEALWESLTTRDEKGTLDKDEQRFFDRLAKTLRLLAENPRHSGLHSHDIDALTRRYGSKVWQSYLENRKPSAGRVFWAYGPDKGEITILSVEPHPDSSKNQGYAKVLLSALPRAKRQR